MQDALAGHDEGGGAQAHLVLLGHLPDARKGLLHCLLYTSDAADDLLCVDLGGRRIITQKNHIR